MFLELGCPLVMEVIARTHIPSVNRVGFFLYLDGLDCYQDQYNIDCVALVLFLMQTVMYWLLTL